MTKKTPITPETVLRAAANSARDAGDRWQASELDPSENCMWYPGWTHEDEDEDKEFGIIVLTARGEYADRAERIIEEYFGDRVEIAYGDVFYCDGCYRAIDTSGDNMHPDYILTVGDITCKGCALKDPGGTLEYCDDYELIDTDLADACIDLADEDGCHEYAVAQATGREYSYEAAFRLSKGLPCKSWVFARSVGWQCEYFVIAKVEELTETGVPVGDWGTGLDSADADAAAKLSSDPDLDLLVVEWNAGGEWLPVIYVDAIHSPPWKSPRIVNVIDLVAKVASAKGGK